LRYRNDAILFKGNCHVTQKYEGQETVSYKHDNKVWQNKEQYFKL
jgi:hypothetical protein